MAIDFHMDFNPTEKFSKGKPAARKKKAKDDEHLNLFGHVDEGAIVEENYQAALKKYPTPNTCGDLAGTIASIDNEIKKEVEQKALTTSSGGSGRVENRFIEGYTKR